MTKIPSTAKDIDLEPCPWCKTNEHLVAGHESWNTMAVYCMECHCTGPKWGLNRVTGPDGTLTDEVYNAIKDKEGNTSMEALEQYMLERAIEDWNKQDGNPGNEGQDNGNN
jgi:hypothetical protein